MPLSQGHPITNNNFSLELVYLKTWRELAEIVSGKETLLTCRQNGCLLVTWKLIFTCLKPDQLKSPKSLNLERLTIAQYQSCNDYQLKMRGDEMNRKNIRNTWGKPLIFTLFIALSVLNFKRIDSVSHSASDTLRPFIIQTIILVFLFLIVYYLVKKAKNILSRK